MTKKKDIGLKRNRKNTHRYVIAELVLLVLIVGVLLLFTPSRKGITQENRKTFFSFRNAHSILIDDNPDFSSPKKIDKNVTVLEPDTYYWKAIGLLGESKTGNFTIDSRIILSMEKDNGTIVRNEGNMPVNFSKKKGNSVLMGSMIVDVNEKVIIENKSDVVYEAKQVENE